MTVSEIIIRMIEYSEGNLHVFESHLFIHPDLFKYAVYASLTIRRKHSGRRAECAFEWTPAGGHYIGAFARRPENGIIRKRYAVQIYNRDALYDFICYSAVNNIGNYFFAFSCDDLIGVCERFLRAG